MRHDEWCAVYLDAIPEEAPDYDIPCDCGTSRRDARLAFRCLATVGLVVWMAECFDLANESVPYAGEYFDLKYGLTERLARLAESEPVRR